MLKKSKDHDSNYLATVVEIDNLKDHPNADRLQIFEIYGGNVIVAKGLYPIGEKVVYFPIESVIDKEFLSWANLLDKPEYNADGKSKGFFAATKPARVKPIKLRSVPSEGFVYPVSKIAEFYGISEKVFKVGESFDMVGDKVLLEKYVPKNNQTNNVEKKERLPKWVKALPRPIRKFIGERFYNKKDTGIGAQIVPGQFQFHYSTPQLAKTLFAVSPDDEITISDKWHGTSFCASRLLCYRDKKWFEKLFNVKYNRLEKEYRNIYNSRSVIKNRRDGKYTEDVWGEWARELFNTQRVHDGVSIFGEIVGFVNHSKMIQKFYDYGCAPGTNDLRVYRMTKTDENGNVREFSFKEIQEYCSRYDLNTVPVFYQGIAKDLFPEIPVDDDWRKNFLAKLSEKYLEGDCQFCKNEVPAEGIVLRVESNEKKPALKLKSFRFSLKESEERDDGEVNVEEEA